MNDVLLRARIRALVKTGIVPCDEPDKVWAGRGTGTHCLACGEPITATEIEYEVELGAVTFRLHLQCFAIWRAECEPPAELSPR
jgi:hypothetical protein